MKISYRILFALLISLLLFGCGDKTAGIEGKITDGQGQPISGLSVIIKQVQPTAGYEQFETKTGPDGMFSMTGLMPLSEYTILPLSDKWKTLVSERVTTLEAGKKYSITKPIIIRYQAFNDGTVLDSKTGMQWFIHPAADQTADTVLQTVRSLNVAGFTDWRLPTREQLTAFEQEKVPSKPDAEPAFVQKTCCAWVIEPDSDVVDWKFYIEDKNEFWMSNTNTPDQRVIVVRDSKAAVAKADEKPAEQEVSTAPAADEQTASAAVQPDASPVKLDPGVRYASRKACAEKKALAAKTVTEQPAATTPSAEPVAAAPIKEDVKVAEAVVKPAPEKKKEVLAKAVEPASSGKTITLYFDTGKTSLGPRELVRLKSFYSQIKDATGTILIDGHCDSTKQDNAGLNLKLSLDRSYSVASALKRMGLSHKNVAFELRGMGEGKPVSSNDTAEGRQRNRRVEITFMEK
ncbi:MAG: OmpA family protein [Smithellaceae bacterium]